MIWHNDEPLIERDDDGRLVVIGTGDMYVALPEDYPEEQIAIDNIDGDVQVRRFPHIA